jgi:hypothetical protein
MGVRVFPTPPCFSKFQSCVHFAEETMIVHFSGTAQIVDKTIGKIVNVGDWKE